MLFDKLENWRKHTQGWIMLRECKIISLRYNTNRNK